MADAPYAFSSSYQREHGRPDEFWDHLATQSEEATEGITVVGIDRDEWIALAGVFMQEDDRSSGYVWGMWVAPDARRRGIGRQMIEAIHDWAVGVRLASLRLSVSNAPESIPARRLYEDCGFQATGEVEEMASDPALRAYVMTLQLRG